MQLSRREPPAGARPARVTWTVRRGQARVRLRIALPAVLAFAATAFFVKEAWEALMIVGMAAAILVAALVYALVAKDRTYALWSEGFLVRRHGKPDRFHRWSSFAGFQTHAEATARRHRGLAQEVSEQVGETFILEPKSGWRFGTSLPTTKETEDEVRRALAEVLPHRPGRHVNALVMVLALAIAVLVLVVAFLLSR